jgi:hypothetical protein
MDRINGGEKLTGVLGFHRGCRRRDQVVDLRQALVASGKRRVHDGVREVMTISRARSSSRSSSRRGCGSRLEIVGVAGCFGRAPARRSTA